MRVSIIILVFLAIGNFVLAQTPGLKKFDLNKVGSSYPMYLTPFNAANGGKLCFFADEGIGDGFELYTCDGVNQPVLVLDLNPLAGSAVEQYSNRPTIVLNNKLYFTGNSGTTGPEIYVFNGATMPTLVQDIVTGNEGSDPDDYVALNGVLYFRARNSNIGYELWSYDPVAATPANQLTDINPGPDSSVNGNLTVFNNKIYFTADSGIGNNELFEFDPVFGNTSLLADIKAGPAGSWPQNLTVLNGKMYFSAADTAGRELWVYNGTNNPTRITDAVRGFRDGIPSRSETIIASMNGKIYFNAKDSNDNNYYLFTYDETTGNYGLAPKIKTTGSQDPLWITPYGGKLYFSAYNQATGYELWSYDTTDGAKQVMDLCIGTNSSDPKELTVIGNDLYFRAQECGGVGTELFKFNYTEVSVKNVSFAGDLKVFPNPASEYINLSLKGKKQETIHIIFTDQAGKTVNECNVSSDMPAITINTKSWVPGMYYYTAYNKDGVRYIVGKIVKN